MAKLPTIGSVMTAFPYFIEVDAHAAAAKTMMQQFKIHHLPVRDGDKIVGVISEQELRRAQAYGRDISSDADTRVAEVCTREVCVADPDEPLDAVLKHMAEAHVDVACIVKGGKLAGIYTFSDVCRQFAESLRVQATK
jgi:acetoin utilization protein AcuB